LFWIISAGFKLNFDDGRICAGLVVSAKVFSGDFRLWVVLGFVDETVCCIVLCCIRWSLIPMPHNLLAINFLGIPQLEYYIGPLLFILQNRLDFTLIQYFLFVMGFQISHYRRRFLSWLALQYTLTSEGRLLIGNNVHVWWLKLRGAFASWYYGGCGHFLVRVYDFFTFALQLLQA